MNPETTAIVDRVRAILMARAPAEMEITPATRIGADLAIDSVEMLDLVMEVEEAYDITFPIEEAAAVATVGALVDAIGRRAHD